MSGIRVLLVHDYELARLGLRRMLEEHEDIEVVGEAGNAVEALSQVDTVSPDVILLDAEMPHVSGLELTRILKERSFPGAVIVLGIDIRRLDDAMQLGAGGYLVQDAQDDELVSAIRRAPDGGFVFGASIMKTAQGKEIALRYLTVQPVWTPQVPPESAAQAVAAPGAPSQDAPAEAAAPNYFQTQAAARELVRNIEEAAVRPTTEERSAGAPEPPPDRTDPATVEPIPALGTVVTDVELVIPPPLEPTAVLKLHQWLTEVANADVGEMVGSWTGDTVIKVTLRRPVPLLRMLAESPDVVEVTEEPYPESTGPAGGVLRSPAEILGIGRGRVMPKRIRLVLKAD